jgi:hypothetical protein
MLDDGPDQCRNLYRSEVQAGFLEDNSPRVDCEAARSPFFAFSGRMKRAVEFPLESH